MSLGDGRLALLLEDAQNHYSTLKEMVTVCACILRSYIRYELKENYKKCSNQVVYHGNIVTVAVCKMYRIGAFILQVSAKSLNIIFR